VTTREEVRAAQEALRQQQTDAAIQGLPPGYIDGMELTLTKEYKIEVSPGVMNVAGKMVKNLYTYTVRPSDWEANKDVSSWYYLYFTTAGQFFVDAIAPGYETDYMAYYHPAQDSWRNIGKFYVGSGGNILYVQSKFDKTRPFVLVAPSPFAGEVADYYCDGSYDEILINAAIKYLNEAFSGGRVELAEGTFVLTTDYITMLDDIDLVGRVARSIVTAPDANHGIYASAKTNIKIRNLKVTSNAAGNYALIYTLNCVDVVIDNNVVTEVSRRGILAAGSTGTKITNNHIYFGTTGVAATGIIGIDISGLAQISVVNNTIDGGAADITNPSAAYGIFITLVGGDWGYAQQITIAGNTIRDITVTGFGVTGIATTSVGYGCIIHGNIIRNLSTDTGAVEGIILSANVLCYGNDVSEIISYADIVADGILASSDENVIASNKIEHCLSAGIAVSGGNNSLVAGNYCINNGNVIDHADCETVNLPHITGDAFSLVNCTWAQSGDQAYEGSYSYKLFKIAGGSSSIARMSDNANTTDMHGLTAGRTYHFTGYGYVPTSGGPSALSEVILVIAYYDSAAWTYTTVSPTAYDEWQLLDPTAVTIPATATGAYVYVALTSSGSASEYAYFDKFRLWEVGVGNEHETNFADAGTDTQTHSNSWQQPITGEPCIGEAHFKRETLINNGDPANTNPITVTPATTPKNTKAVSGWYQFTASGAGAPTYIEIENMDGHVYERSQSVHNTTYSVRGNFYVPLDANGQFQYHAAHANVQGVYIYMRRYYT
jgi:parallel beta-helix repeat protein